MKRSLSTIHGASTGIALTLGGAIAIIATLIWPDITAQGALAISTIAGGGVRFLEALIAPVLQRRKLRMDLEMARLRREAEGSK